MEQPAKCVSTPLASCRAARWQLLLLTPHLSPSRMRTCLATDIQQSTKLWEELPVMVMDQALRLHHATLRMLLQKHSG